MAPVDLEAAADRADAVLEELNRGGDHGVPGDRRLLHDLHKQLDGHVEHAEDKVERRPYRAEQVLGHEDQPDDIHHVRLRLLPGFIVLHQFLEDIDLAEDQGDDPVNERIADAPRDLVPERPREKQRQAIDVEQEVSHLGEEVHHRLKERTQPLEPLLDPVRERRELLCRPSGELHRLVG